MSQTIVFTIAGAQRIGCPGCEAAIRRCLMHLRGVRQVQADRRTQCVTVRLEPAQTNAETVKARLMASGYEVTQTA